ncbi:MAG: hypothetical protein ACMXYG_00605 [Candidatus Woesearchaeota archaeon]
MSKIEIRKLQIVGNRSFSISLPKWWVESKKLKAQDNVFIEPTNSNDLLIRTETISTLDNSVSINIGEIKNLSGFILLCYVNNIDLVKIHSKKFDAETIRKLNHALRHLDGYEITSESESLIEISFLFNDINISLDRIMRRMIYLTKLLIDSLQKNDKNSINDVENTIDRLYHLAKRIIFKSQIDSNVRSQNGIINQKDLFFIWDSFKKIENIADTLVKLVDIGINQKDCNLLQSLLDFIEKAWQNSKNSDALILKFSEIKILLKDSEKKDLLDAIYDLSSDILENQSYINMNSLYFK